MSRASEFYALTAANQHPNPISTRNAKAIPRHLPTGRAPKHGGVGADLLKFGGGLFKGYGFKAIYIKFLGSDQMFSYVEFLEVVEFHVSKISNTDRMSQALTLKIPRTKTKFHVQICNRIRLPDLKKGDKVKLVLDFYTCARSKMLRWTVRDVILLHDLSNVKTEIVKKSKK